MNQIDAAAPDGVSALRPDHTDEAAAVLLASHAQYPAFVALWPDEATRRRALLPFLRASVAGAVALSAGTLGRAQGRPVAVALWQPPGAFPWSPPRKLRAFPALLRTALASPRAFRRFARLGASAEREHPQDPHWYLEALGVHPSAQGQGWARRALEPGLRRADDAGLGCYVETSDGGNVPFYRRLGFEVIAPRLDHLRGGPAYTGMWRSPR